ncbi:hypothetical protein DH2020_039705 [Rehmannia glutinosa]|uniref:CCT domain-containing protein n=1 Tax=Rehmannia glutinosa TaxID=99300 RepID=A0ABR0UW92_REHGL
MDQNPAPHQTRPIRGGFKSGQMGPEQVKENPPDPGRVTGPYGPAPYTRFIRLYWEFGMPKKLNQPIPEVPLFKVARSHTPARTALKALCPRCATAHSSARPTRTQSLVPFLCSPLGGGRAYRLDLDLIKSPTSSWTSNSSSLSESSNSPVAISTRKTRTPRKRPNQTYNEAASILSTAYPKIFPTKHLTKPCKFTKPHDNHQIPFPFEPSDLLMPFQVIDSSGYLLPILKTPDNFPIRPKNLRGEISSLQICDEFEEDFDAESILDEEIEEGIDSIMGNSITNNETVVDSNNCNTIQLSNTCCYGYPVGLGFDSGYGMRRELSAMRNVDERDDWWRFPSVNLADITQKIAKIPVEKKKKKKNKQSSFATTAKENLASTASSEDIHRTGGGLRLKLNYDDVLNAWSDKGSPFSGDGPAEESAGNDVQARLAQIDLFPENRAARGAIVLRYKEKRRTRLISKKIRYQVRKVNADQRPRMKACEPHEVDFSIRILHKIIRGDHKCNSKTLCINKWEVK